MQSIFMTPNRDLIRRALFPARFHRYLFYNPGIPGAPFIAREECPACLSEAPLDILYRRVAALVIVLEERYRIRGQVKAPWPVVIRPLLDYPPSAMSPVRLHAAYYRPRLPYPRRVSEHYDEALVICLRGDSEVRAGTFGRCRWTKAQGRKGYQGGNERVRADRTSFPGHYALRLMSSGPSRFRAAGAAFRAFRQ